jgi:hypothetical protein
MRVAQTENVLPGSGFSARTPNVQLFKYEHLYYTAEEVILQVLERVLAVVCAAQDGCAIAPCGARTIHLPPELGSPLAQS